MTQKIGLDLTKGSIAKQLILFFFPIFLGSFFQQFYNTTDALIVGRFVGYDALAAIESTGSLTRTLVQFFIGVASGATILISQAFGARDDERVSKTVHTAISFALWGSLIVTALGLSLAPTCLKAMHVPKDIEFSAILYAEIFFVGVLPTFIYTIGAAILRAIGDSRRPFYFLVVCCFLNIGLDIVFVLVLGMGVAGVGIATVLAQAVSALLVVRALCKAKGYSYQLHVKQIHITKVILKRIVYLGLPIGLQSAMYGFSNILIQAKVNTFGTDMVAAWAVTGKVDFIIWILLDALTISVSTFVAQNYGAGLITRVKKCLPVATGVGFTMFGVLSIGLYIFAPQLSKIFLTDPNVIEMTVQLLRFFAPVYWMYIIGDLCSGAIRGTGDSLHPMILTFIGTCVVRIAWVMVVPAGRPIWDTILCYPVTWIGTSILYLIYVAIRGGIVKRNDPIRRKPQEPLAGMVAHQEEMDHTIKPLI